MARFSTKKTIEYKICVLIFSTTVVRKIRILRRTERDSVSLYRCLNVKCPLFLSDMNEPGIFSTDFSKNTQISNAMKICPVGAELFHADGRTNRQTDKMKLTVFFFR